MSENSDRSEGDAAGGALAGGDLGLDELFGVLADRRRRYALYRLRQVGGEVRLSALVGAVLEWETGIDVESLPDERRQRAYLEFYHNHVPLLADHGLVSYSRTEGIVRLEADLEEAAWCFERARAHDDVPPGDGDAGGGRPRPE